MKKCTHCLRYFVADVTQIVDGYIKCPHCGELVKI